MEDNKTVLAGKIENLICCITKIAEESLTKMSLDALDPKRNIDIHAQIAANRNSFRSRIYDILTTEMVENFEECLDIRKLIDEDNI